MRAVRSAPRPENLPEITSRRTSACTRDAGFAEDLLFLAAWELGLVPWPGAILRVRQLRRANPAFTAVRAEVASWPVAENSQVGRGTTVTVLLPRYADAAEHGSGRKPADAAADGTVRVVEDHRCAPGPRSRSQHAGGQQHLRQTRSRRSGAMSAAEGARHLAANERQEVIR